LLSPLVLFGIDSRGKPRRPASEEHAGLAVKAASQLALQVLAGTTPARRDAARLPVGRVHATGRTFVPSSAATL